MSAANEWKLEKKRKGIEVYSKSSPETKYQDIKSTTTITSDINTIINVYSDFEHYPQWQNFMRKMEVSGSTDKDKFIAYAEYDFPWPISNRDIVIKAEMAVLPGEKKSVVLDITGASHPEFPEKDGTIRIKEYHCRALLEELNENLTKVTYIIEADPGGNMPALCVNLAAREAQFLTLNNLKKLVRKKNREKESTNLRTTQNP